MFIYNYNDYLKHSKMKNIFYSQFLLKERGNDLGCDGFVFVVVVLEIMEHQKWLPVSCTKRGAGLSV